MAVDMNVKILVVDDDRTMLRILRTLLGRLNFGNVDAATDGSMALAKLRDDDFGLVISDWNMQPMTGIELLREVRADENLRHIPFVMVTAESKPEKVIAANEAGVSSYIVKPFDAETLKARIAGVLGDF